MGKVLVEYGSNEGEFISIGGMTGLFQGDKTVSWSYREQGLL